MVAVSLLGTHVVAALAVDDPRVVDRSDARWFVARLFRAEEERLDDEGRLLRAGGRWRPGPLQGRLRTGDSLLEALDPVLGREVRTSLDLFERAPALMHIVDASVREFADVDPAVTTMCGHALET